MRSEGIACGAAATGGAGGPSSLVRQCETADYEKIGRPTTILNTVMVDRLDVRAARHA